jgi:hypothetical protein
LIDTLKEQLFPLTDALQFVPRPKGRTPNLSTLYRWSQRGIKGVRLETVQVGGTRCTTREALGRFFGRVTAARDGTPRADQRATAAQAALTSIGI